MTALLEIVSEACELYAAAKAERAKAIRNALQARDGRGRRMFTGVEIARAAGVSKQRISAILNEHREEEE